MKYLLVFFLTGSIFSFAGDPLIGKKLFYGYFPFKNGGLQCMACHQVNGKGGTLGPDLTKVYTRYGGSEGLKAVLSGETAFPSMKPVFRNSPLTKEEIENLSAFFEEAAKTGKETGKLPGAKFFFALGGFIVFLVGGQVFWRGRLKSVRKRLVESSRY
ncbi:MAG: cytochrome c [Hydrogenobacter thermophilus]|uniref:c-type cytochrome n=1 Tax=Hydrogenobacter thermophilus TaxID=940 RepID=UPI001C746725|nr:c-type cytochrome [Hydrogenobacter thermophilus]QWK19223.1 MAG: cytochrome c [Hydrogenobacter thermophilus]